MILVWLKVNTRVNKNIMHDCFRLEQFSNSESFFCNPEQLELDNSELIELLDTLIGSSETFSTSNITNILADLRRKLDANYLFSMYVEVDEKNTTNHIIYVILLILAIDLYTSHLCPIL